jgi:hypothetical protein
VEDDKVFETIEAKKEKHANILDDEEAIEKRNKDLET